MFQQVKNTQNICGHQKKIQHIHPTKTFRGDGETSAHPQKKTDKIVDVKNLQILPETSREGVSWIYIYIYIYI